MPSLPWPGRRGSGLRFDSHGVHGICGDIRAVRRLQVHLEFWFIYREQNVGSRKLSRDKINVSSTALVS
jgi:hypothetical protein